MQLKAFRLKQTSHKNGMVTSIKVPVDPTIDPQEWNSSNTVEVKFPVCNTNGEPKACIEFRTNLEHLAQSFGGAFTIEKQKQINRVCLGPNTYRIYQEEWDSLVEDNAEAEEEDQLDGEQMMHLAFNALAKDAFPNPEDAYRHQKRYMRNQQMLGADDCPEKFANSLVAMNNVLPCYPCDEATQVDPPTSLEEDELL